MAVAEYYCRVNRDLLALIPPDARTVLEIGCGCGALAEAYRRINPGVRWWGVEANGEAVEVARQPGRCDEVLYCDVEDIRIDMSNFYRYYPGELGQAMMRSYPMELQQKMATYSSQETKYEDLPPGCDPDEPVDCLVFGDVLEHLQNPWRILRDYTKGLKPGGLVLACIPNVQHWTIIQGLLRGEWDYQDEGLLDRGHLRFFTLKSIREMFASAGLKVFEIRGRPSVLPDDNAGHREFWGESLRRTSSSGPLWDQTRVYQYIVRAAKPPAEVKPLHIHAVLGELCCARPRIEEPLGMLATVPGVRVSIGRFGADPQPNQIVIQQRYRHIDIEAQRRLIDDGCLLIAEWDDDPEVFPELVASDYLPLRAVHAVQVSTEALAEVVRQYNPEVAVFPNQIADLPPLREPASYEGVRIFYGAQNRKADWLPIMPALNRVLRDHPEAWMCVLHDLEFFEALDTVGKAFHPFCEYEAYRSALRTCDIALLPLEPTRFNRMKSDLKFLECASESVTCLMSEFAADQIDPHPNDAYRCYSSPEQFERFLRVLIEQPDGRRRTAEIAYAYVAANRLLGQHFRTRLDWYKDLLARREELHQGLLSRVPKLGKMNEPSMR